MIVWFNERFVSHRGTFQGAMRMRQWLMVGGVCCLVVLSARWVGAGGASKVELTPKNTKIEFVGTKPNGKHDGGFAKFSGAIENVAPGLKGSKIVVEIQTESLFSDTPKLTKHLLSADFFEAKAHPKAKFTSTAIEAKKDGSATHRITGDLMLRGVTKSVSFPATVKQAGNAIELTSEFMINKKDFGMTYGEGKIDHDVKIKVAVKTK
jgi:polyisoprenoid-binding protein YceI